MVSSVYKDIDLTQADEAALTLYRRNTVGFIFQFYNLIPSLTARENVALITEIARGPDGSGRGFGHGEPGRPAWTIFPRNYPAENNSASRSRGQSPSGPKCLLCDEPTGALDVRTGIVVLEAIQRVNEQLGTLTVVITHNAVMAEMADRVVHISDGRVHDVLCQ